jgi:hypothetical protein
MIRRMMGGVEAKRAEGQKCENFVVLALFVLFVSTRFHH